MSESYIDRGVNFKLGDEISAALYEASKLTWSNREGRYGEMVELHDSFSGLRAMPMGKLGNTSDLYDNMNTDGVGTKVEVAERLEDHSTVAFDLFAMAEDDAAIKGCEPIKINTILDIRKLDDTAATRKAVKELCIGYVAAAAAGDVVVTNGEIAELGDRIHGYGEFNYNWGATVHWVGLSWRMLSGRDVRPGDKLIGVRENGFRSNGLTDARAAFNTAYGPEWHKQYFEGHGELGRLVLQPSIINTKALVDMSGGYDKKRDPRAPFHAAAHITGGGLPEKLRRALEPSGLGAIVDDPYEPPFVMQHAQELSDMPDEKAARKWNGGQGLVIITDKTADTLDVLAAHNKEAKVIGEVTEDTEIQIRSKWANKYGSFLLFAN